MPAGSSGCGKSTLLNIIAGLEMPDQGRVLADESPVNGPGSDRMVMFQESTLYPWLDVLGNVLFGLKLKPGLTRRERAEVALFISNSSAWKNLAARTFTNSAAE